jgi:hypothetical protein
MAAVLASAPARVVKGHQPIVASHRSAAWLWDVLAYRPQTIEVAAPKPRRSQRPYVVHCAPLSRDERSVRKRIPATSLARTCLDLAATERPRTFRRILSRAFDSRLDLGAAGLERRFLEVVEEAGLPTPSMNAFVAGHEIDAWWEAERFGVELDVYETHGSRLSFEEDRVRDDELLLAGIETTRVTGARLDREPDAVIDSVRGHLARRAAA